MRRPFLLGWGSLTALVLGLVLYAGLIFPISIPAAPGIPRTIDTSGVEFINPQTQQAIDRGLAYLAAQQNEDGSFGSGTVFSHNIAVTSLSGIAFLSAGNTPGRGKYGRQVDRALKYILEHVGPNGFITARDTSPHGPMYDHGFATLFLAEVYGMSPMSELREKLALAVKLIINTQNREGGWRYQPVRGEADISATVCQIMALRAARNSGLFVPKDTVDACVLYVQKCQVADGGFRYQLGPTLSPSAFPRSAAALVSLYSAGVYDGPSIKRGLEYMKTFTPTGEVFRHENNYFYGHYYAVQAMWHAGGAHWNRWYPAIRDELLERQMPNDGSWPDSVCNEYGTAMACIILQMPNQYVPIFQR
jgi:hypothetical protein